MNTTEAKEIYDELFVAFPGYREWLMKFGTDSAKKTHAVWCQMLDLVPYPAAKKAVERMLSGDMAMPQAYERDQLPLFIKNYALRIDQDERSKRRSAREASEARRASESIRDSPWRYGLRSLLVRMMDIGHELRDGKITKTEHDAEYRRLMAMSQERN